MALVILHAAPMRAQVTFEGNSSVNSSTDYVGWDNTTTSDPLQILHKANQPIQFGTDGTKRMVLWRSQSPNINGYSSVSKPAYVAISARPAFLETATSDGPFSRLHLVDNTLTSTASDYAPDFGYRPWMRNGVTFTGNRDLGYIGQAYNGTGVSDMVLSWSDATTSGPWTADRLRFVFTADNDASTNGMGSDVGLEAMRMWPADADNVNIGIGDWQVGTPGDPSERLDLLTGKLRIRDLPNDAIMSGATQMMVVDNTGVVGWQDIPPLECDWELDDSNNDLTTAWDPSPSTGCPAQDWNVGIGLNSSLTGKLTVLDDLAASSATLGIDVLSGADGTVDTGVKSKANGLETNGSLSTTATGVVAIAENAHTTHAVNATATLGSGKTANTEIVGVMSNSNTSGTSPLSAGVVSYGTAGSSSTITQLYGVLGVGLNTASGSVTTLVGVAGYANGSYSTGRFGVYGDASGGTNSWAGNFNGPGTIAAASWNYTSDASLKTNIEPITDATSKLMQLEPSDFEYLTGSFPTIHLPSGLHHGLIAQEVETVFPELVNEVTQPAVYDDQGNLVHQAVTFKGVGYTELISVLIAGFQEQQAVIASLQDQINGCCNEGMAPQGGEGNGIGYIDNTQTGTAASRQLNADELVVTPNPFTENPTISYRIGTGGRAQLRVTSASSRDMGVLFDAGTEAGQYNMVWNTEGMAPGLYLLTLTVDGKRVTEQAVKVE